MQAIPAKILSVSVSLLLFLGILQQCSSPSTQVSPTEVLTAQAPTEVILVTEMVEPTEEVAIAAEPSPQFSNWITLEVLRGSAILESSSLGVLEFFAGDTYKVESVREFDVKRFETGMDGYARIYYFDDLNLYTELKPGTIIYYNYLKPGDIRFYQEFGRTYNVIEGLTKTYYEVATPVAVVKAEGTREDIGLDEYQNLDVGVQEGEVLVETPDGSKTTVNEGQRMEVASDGTPVQPTETIFVAVDISHLDDVEDFPKTMSMPSVYFTNLQNTLEANKFFVEYITDLKYITIKSKDVLVSIWNETPFSDEEIVDIQRWVDEGNGLFIAGENSGAYVQEDSANKLLEPYGINFIGVRDTMTQTVNTFFDHEVTKDISQLPLDWTNGLNGGIELGYSSQGLLILSAYENAGRVLVYADATALCDRYWSDDLSKFVVNAFEWLAWRR